MMFKKRVDNVICDASRGQAEIIPCIIPFCVLTIAATLDLFSPMVAEFSLPWSFFFKFSEKFDVPPCSLGVLT